MAPEAPPVRDENPAAETIAGIPRLDAVRPITGLRYLRATWSKRHLIVTIALLPVLGLLYWGSAGGSAAGPGMLVVVAAAALIGALVLASYVPPRGTRGQLLAGGGACAAMPPLAVLGAAWLLGQGAATGNVVPALLIPGVAAVQRLWGPASCG